VAPHAFGLVCYNLIILLVIGVNLIRTLPHTDLAFDTPAFIPPDFKVPIILILIVIKHVSFLLSFLCSFTAFIQCK